MSALAWLIFAAIIVALALVPLSYVVQGWATRRVNRMTDNRVAILTQTDDEFWAAYVDEAIALTVPLYGSEAACKIAAIIAHNEAARFDADAVDWTQPSRWVQ